MLGESLRQRQVRELSTLPIYLARLHGGIKAREIQRVCALGPVAYNSLTS